MPLDINLFRTHAGGNPELIRESQRRRFAPVELVDEIIAKDDRWRYQTGTSLVPMIIRKRIIENNRVQELLTSLRKNEIKFRRKLPARRKLMNHAMISSRKSKRSAMKLSKLRRNKPS